MPGLNPELVENHQKEKYTIQELDFSVMWLQTPLKKDKISALGGGYNYSIVILSSPGMDAWTGGLTGHVAGQARGARSCRAHGGWATYPPRPCKPRGRG